MTKKNKAIHLYSADATLRRLLPPLLRCEGWDVGASECIDDPVAQDCIIIWDAEAPARGGKNWHKPPHTIIIGGGDGDPLAIQKPLSLRRLGMALRNLGTQIAQHRQQEDGFHLDTGKRILYLGKASGRKAIRLSEKESTLLERLYQARKHAVPLDKARLMREVWGHTKALESHTLETHMHRLRGKIAGTPLSIRKHRDGYLLELPPEGASPKASPGKEK